MALFERGGDSLRPVELPRRDRFDADLLTILKYPGKTNEVFTKLLLNVTVWSGNAVSGRPLRVLDPMCGRGTTLNQVLMNGWHASGLDVDGRDFDTYSAFLRTWLKTKRLKHDADVTPGPPRGRQARAPTARRGRRDQGGVEGRGRAHRRVREHRHPEHAGRPQGGVDGRGRHRRPVRRPARQPQPHARGVRLTRSPLDLLREAVPVWVDVLRPGGALGIAWNTHVAARDDALAVLAAAGLEVLDDGAYRAFPHRVDQAIQRDVLVARRPV